MNTVTLFSVMTFVWKVWPVVSRLVPLVLAVVRDLADKELSGAAKREAVFLAARKAVSPEIVPDALLNWLIETVVQMTRLKTK